MNRSKRMGNVLAYVILGLGALVILFPLYICITTTFKTPSESAISFFTLPQSFYLGNYSEVLHDGKLYMAYKNTIFITACSLLAEFLIMPPMSYALSRSVGHSKLFRGLYYFFLMGIFLPFQVRMMPLVKLMSSLNLMSPGGMVLLYLAHATCESMFLYVGYLATVSPSLEEAAYIDGASTFKNYTHVILPLMKPILATVLIREGLAIWNDFQLPLVCLNRSQSLWTLTIYQNNFQSEYNVDYNLAFACLIVASLPIVIFYIIMQKQIIGGLTNGAVKG